MPDVNFATRQELAEWYGTSVQAITDWKKNGCRPLEHKWSGREVWSTRAVHQWLMQRELKKAGLTQADENEGLSKSEQEARLKYHQANNEELKELQSKGELIPRTEVIKGMSSLVGAARSKFLAIPSKMQGRYGELTSEMADDLTTLIHEALTELSEEDLVPVVEDSTESLGTAA